MNVSTTVWLMTVIESVVDHAIIGYNPEGGRGNRKWTYLFVELDIGGLELLLNVRLAEVVGELIVRIRHALGSFLGSIVSNGRLRHSVQRDSLVLRVSNLVQVHMGDFLVNQASWVVRGRVAWQLGEVLWRHRFSCWSANWKMKRFTGPLKQFIL